MTTEVLAPRARDEGMVACPPLPADVRVLTSMRIFAAVWVLLHHYLAYFQDQVLPLDPLLRAGALGVDFFFVLSGFVLAHVYSPKIAAGRFDYWSFVTRRVARIYPLHLAMLVVMILFGLVASRTGWAFTIWTPAEFLNLDRGTLLRAAFANVTMIHAWGAVKGLYFNIPSWSISAEWFAYLTYPVMALFVLKVRHVAVAIGLAVLILFGLLAGAKIGVLAPLISMTWNIGVLRIVPEFLLGLALHRLASHWTAGRNGALAGIAGSLFALVATIYLGLAPQFQVLALAGLILFLADTERHGALRMMTTDFPVLLGEISYSVYMIHTAVGMVFFELLVPSVRGHGALVALLAIAACLVVVTLLSWLSHRFFELPARRMLIRVTTLPRAQAGD